MGSWTIIKEPEPWTLINEPVDVPYENLGKFGSPSIDSWTKVERDIHAIGERIGNWVKEKGPGHALLSAGLGLAGFAIGVPCVPGITDNLIVGAAGALLPRLQASGSVRATPRPCECKARVRACR